MGEIVFPLNPRPREDPAAAGVVQENLEYVMQLFEKGKADGDILVWDLLLGRYLAKSAGGIETVTSLPLVDLYPGREVILTNNPLDPGYLWNLRYNIDSPSAYKWEFLGGSPAISVVEGEPGQSTSSIVYVDLATLGPDIQIPAGIGGDFLVEVGNISRGNILGREARMSYSIAGSSAQDADGVVSTINDYQSVSNKRRKNNVPSGALIRAKYRTSNGADPASFRQRWLAVQPYRVG